MESFALNNTPYGFSAVPLGTLGSTEQTLATLVLDVSGSVYGFRKELESMLETILKTLVLSPRKDSLMFRLLLFNHMMNEVHGFKLLVTCNAADYVDIIKPGGGTSLYLAVGNAVEAELQYGGKLTAADFSTNGIIFIVTDGDDNGGGLTPAQIKSMIEAGRSGENLESLRTILIEIGLSPRLASFVAEAGIDQHIELRAATPSSLGKLADFISKSISSQSASLGTGGPSQPITF